MGARGRARDRAGTSRSSSGKNDNASSDSGTSLRNHQVLDGSNALSHETAAESSNRDGAQCARLQHEARDGDHWRGRAAAGLGRLSRGAPRVQINANKCPRERLERSGSRFCSDRYPTIAEANVALTMVLIPTPFHTAWANSGGKSGRNPALQAPELYPRLFVMLSALPGGPAGAF